MIARMVALSVLALALTPVVASCHLVAGTSDFESVAEKVCGCPGVATAFSQCVDRVNESLADAGDNEAEEWLANVHSLDCGGCEEQTELLCLQLPPVCRRPLEKCEGIFDCCGTLEGEAFCHDGRCARDEPTCKESFEACTKDKDCCGSSAGLGFCVDSEDGQKACLQLCGDNEANCLGCCSGVSITGIPEITSICLGATNPVGGIELPLGEASCEIACISGEDDSGCAEGTQCVTIPSPLGTFTFDACGIPD